MRIATNSHDDARRLMIEWVADAPIRTCKVLVAKQDCELGNHWHMNKDDWFYLMSGSGDHMIGKGGWQPFSPGDCIKASRGTPHTIRLRAGSILLEASSTPYDKDDELPISY